VRVVAGPQADAFTEAGWETFLASTYTVSARSDRMGCQLDGPVIAHRHGFNIVSDGIVEGSIQVPGSGRPIVLLADRQTTGGYTKIATVIGADLAVFAHLRPGDPVRFSLIDVDEAIRARAEARASLDRTIRRIGPAPVRAGVPDGHDLLAHNLVGGMVSATADPFDGPTSDPGADP
jgi:allophanate hydrolase subunit 2